MTPDDLIKLFENDKELFHKVLINYFTPEEFVEINLCPLFEDDEDEWESMVEKFQSEGVL
jgi:hypothetical protein